MKNEQEFKSAIELTGGTYYPNGSSENMSSIVQNIEKKSKSLIEEDKTVRKIDKPFWGVLILTIAILILYILTKIIKV